MTSVEIKYYINDVDFSNKLTIHYWVNNGKSKAMIKVPCEYKEDLDTILNSLGEDSIEVKYVIDNDKVINSPHFEGAITFMAEAPRKSKKCKLYFLYEFNGVYVK